MKSKRAVLLPRFKRGVTVHTGGDGLRLPPFPEGTDQDLRHGIFNIVIIALSASALTVDETLNEVFGKAWIDTDPTRIGIRVMVNQLRNAFAHNPWRPKWMVFRQIDISIQLILMMDPDLFLTRPNLMAMVLSRNM